MEQDVTYFAVGLIFFVAGAFFLLAYLPTYTSLCLQVTGVEEAEVPLTKSDYSFYIMLDAILIPLLVILTAIGATFLFLGLASSIRRK